MSYVKWTIRILLLLIAAAFLHYTLPQRDIVRVVNTYEERQDFSDLGFTRLFWKNTTGSDAAIVSRDVLFIQTIRANGRPMVYRNQDTGWGWPPYFKFNTANLQTEAADLISSSDIPRWAAITHYGWRNELLSIFPNAVSIRPVAGPDVRLIPWINIVVLLVLAGLILWAWVIWRQFRQRTVDPALRDASTAWDNRHTLDDRARGRFWYWWDRTFRRR
jgi:hypothetical protein